MDLNGKSSINAKKEMLKVYRIENIGTFAQTCMKYTSKRSKVTSAELEVVIEPYSRGSHKSLYQYEFLVEVKGKKEAGEFSRCLQYRLSFTRKMNDWKKKRKPWLIAPKKKGSVGE